MKDEAEIWRQRRRSTTAGALAMLVPTYLPTYQPTNLPSTLSFPSMLLEHAAYAYTLYFCICIQQTYAHVSEFTFSSIYSTAKTKRTNKDLLPDLPVSGPEKVIQKQQSL